jgi:ribokinase/non-canonical purine NTP pyrophosphatase (RdgB/HAM1 family)
VGQDSFGANLLANFRKVGVQFEDDTITAQESHSGVAPIVVDTTTGDNMIIVIPGANYLLTPEDVKSAILAAKPAVVVSQLEIRPETALEAMKTGKQVGAITILNPAPAPEGWSLDEFYPFVDILIPNETELLSICKDGSEPDMARSLLKKGVGKAVVVTLGARGAMIVTKTDNEDETEVTLVKAPEGLPCRDEAVLDTIGAGDAFCGALSTYLSAGLKLTDAATKACGIASMSVRKKGAQTSYPTANELPDCLKIASSHTTVSSTKPTITFVTGNRKKVEEIKRILLDGDTELPFEITSRKIDLPELQGDPLEIAQEKCRLAAKEVNGPVLTEDTSLCFNSLNGMPGPYIKWFLEKCGHDGLNRMLAGFDDKSAYAQTIMAFTTGPGQYIELFDGRTDGTIVPPRGSLDFGWDPVFEPNEGKGKTYAEMTAEEKNAISHRSRSMAKLQAYLHENADDIIPKNKR